MAEELNPQLMDDITSTNFKAGGSAPAQMANALMADFTRNQGIMSDFMTKSAGNTLNQMDQLSIKESQAISGINSTDIGRLIVLLDAIKANSDSGGS